MISSPPLSRPAVFALVTVASVVIVVAVVVLGSGIWPTALLRDFNAFYCAGRAIDAHADPYLAEPLGACERAAKGFDLQHGMPGLAMPAPLPPYALAIFALLARLSYPAAALLWTLLLAGAVVLTVLAMRRVTGLPWAALVASLLLTDFYASACLGQIAPFALAGIAGAAALVEAGQGELAGFAAAVAMLEPHLGIAPCLGLFLRSATARIPLLAAGLGLAALSFATGGVARSLEYLRRVVPAHAASEVVNEKQFSLTHLLYRLGMAETQALHVGEAQFALAVVVGVAAGVALARRYRSDALAVVIPVGFAVVGGPFIHVVQLAASSLAGLALYAKVASRGQRRLLAFALIGLAIPWIQFVNLGTVFPLLAALVAGVLTWTLFDQRPLPLAGIAIAALAFIIELEALIVERLPDPVPRLVRAYDPRALAERSWSLYVHLVATPNAAAYELAKAPTIFGVVAVAGVAVAALFAKRAATSRRGA